MNKPTTFVEQSESVCGLQTSFFWKEPKMTKLVDLNQMGKFVFPFNLEESAVQEGKPLFDYSNNAKFFALIINNLTYIIDCFLGSIQIICQSFDQLFFSNDSKYLILVSITTTPPSINIYNENLGLFEYEDCLSKILPQDYFACKEEGNVLYLIYQDIQWKTMLQTYDLLSKSSSRTIIGMPKYFSYVEIFPTSIPIIFQEYLEMFLDSYQTKSFLMSTNGRRLKRGRAYDQIEGRFGLVFKQFSFWLHFVSNGKQIKKYEHMSRQQNVFPKKVSIQKDDIVVYQKDLTKRENKIDFYSLEVKCINFEKRERCSEQYWEINEGGAFQILKNYICEFYFF